MKKERQVKECTGEFYVHPTTISGDLFILAIVIFIVVIVGHHLLFFKIVAVIVLSFFLGFYRWY